MKLLTHNMLTSKMVKNVVTGYPLKLTATKIEMRKVDFQPEFISRMMQRVNYNVLYEAAQSLNQAEGLPPIADFKEESFKNEDIVKALHKALLEVDIIEGELTCPETGRKFPIQNGIPNMLVNEDEV